MKNWKLAPKDLNVAKYVECYWFLEKEDGDTSHNHPKLNPDPSAHLIVAHSLQPYHYEQDSIVQAGYGSHWIYPHRKTFIMDHADPFKIIGIKFNIGALYALASSHCLPALDKVQGIEINHLMSNELFCTEALLMNAVKNPNQTRDVLDHMLRDWLSIKQEDRHSKLTCTILPLLSTTPIAEIGSALHRSQRTIERSFLRTTGLTLKQCKSMIHLEAILSHLYTLNEIDWLDLAHKYEFSDQPHLIRYLKNSIGETPREYATKRNLTIDIYGDFEFN